MQWMPRVRSFKFEMKCS